MIYMPGHDFAGLREELLAAGLDPDIPAAIVSRASSPGTASSTRRSVKLAKLPRIDSPAILLIGRSLEDARRAMPDIRYSRSMSDCLISLRR